MAADPATAPVALVTGGARRIGAAIARELHGAGYNIVLHCRHSTGEADTLKCELNDIRDQSCAVVGGDLTDMEAVSRLATDALAQFGRLDVLVNNASSFYPTSLGSATQADWDNLIGSNLRGPFFLCQALAPELRKRKGVIVNIADIHGRQPLKNHSVYSIAKAGNIMMTKTLALELAPEVRVNGVAPGVILWPVDKNEEFEARDKIVENIPLGHMGSPEDIAGLTRFLITSPGYITGQVIAVDGGVSR